MKNTLKKNFLSSIILCSLFPQASAINDNIIFLDSSKSSTSSNWDTFVRSVPAGALLATALAGYSWLSRNSKFNKFEQWLFDTSSVSKQYHCFSNWGKSTFGTASSLIKQSPAVRKKLYVNLLNPNFTPFRDRDGNQLHYAEAEKIDTYALSNAFIKEKNDLMHELEYLANFTPLAILIYKNTQSSVTIPLTYNKSVINKIFIQSQEIIENNIEKLVDFENIIAECYSWLKKNNTLDRYLFHRAPIFSKQIVRTDGEQEKEASRNDAIIPINFSYNPLQWKLVNSHKATRLFYEGLKRYIWLLTLEHIIINPDV